MSGRRRLVAAVAAVAALEIAAALVLLTRGPSAPGWAGSAACASCHPGQHALWQESHHGRAQEPAPAGTTLTAPDADGRPAAFPAKVAIGVDPLVQYLVELDRGRWQAAPVAWDPRRREWFDLHAEDPRRPDEWGHWLNRGMTWNAQCAFCHVTDFRKGYDPVADSYASRWREDGVGCESCHGPRAEHVRASPPGNATPRPRLPIDERTGPDVGVETCAPCHSRRRQLAEGWTAGARFLDFFDPVLPDDPAYHADGQVLDEDFEWTSFAQSKMYARGVGCSDCHDPHSGKLRREGSALCLQCHRAELAGSAHVRHVPGSPGAECVSCHMPQTTYMLRHPRRDHSFSIPMPELTTELGIPNACTRCHADRPATWAEARCADLYGRKDRPAAGRARIIAAARAGRAESIPGLKALLGNPAQPGVWRAAAVGLLGRWAGPGPTDTGPILRAAVDDPDPLVRARALRALDENAGSVRSLRMHDPIRLVRVEAAWTGRAHWRGAGPAAYAEAEAVAQLAADMPGGRYARGLIRTLLGDDPGAEAEYRAALRLDASDVPSRMNLAARFSESGRGGEAIALAEEGVKVAPAAARVRFGLGLLYASAGRMEDSVAALTECVRLDPGHPRAQYNLALACLETGRVERARAALEEATRHPPHDEEACRLLEEMEKR